ncbi:unnamed protein product [Moneuplotes crassus]|uniref:Uncharacterized protein n=1 Tax=Euplotes crassus TaxID=5936 RepID=A0AAD1Y0L9_EUPCR|nr:unnamed protein product [Moneuplotes crassus]
MERGLWCFLLEFCLYCKILGLLILEIKEFYLRQEEQMHSIFTAFISGDEVIVDSHYHQSEVSYSKDENKAIRSWICCWKVYGTNTGHQHY